jgi:hypothetical protein
MPPPLIDILSEREMPSGWVFEVGVIATDGALVRSEVRLSFADYNLWSPDGTAAPAAVAEAVVAVLLTKEAVRKLPTSFDAATLRRRYPEADEAVAARVRGG